MRVSAFLMSYPPDRMVGAELMSAELLEALVDAGHSVTVYADLVQEAYTRNGVYVQPRSTFNRMQRTADLVYSHPDLGTIGYIVSQLHKIPYVAVVHNTGDLNRWHLPRHVPTLTVWNSESTREVLGGSGGIVCRPPLRIKDHKAKPGEAFTLVNLSEAKGINTFLAVAQALPEFKAMAVAGGYGLQAKAQAAKVGAEVVGPVPHSQMAAQVWAKTKVLLVPSREESWGRVAAEALASGIPVIAHPTPGLLECLGEAGIFIDREDHETWATEVKALMADDKHYKAASKRSVARARSLDTATAQDLVAFVKACEALVGL